MLQCGPVDIWQSSLRTVLSSLGASLDGIHVSVSLPVPPLRPPVPLYAHCHATAEGFFEAHCQQRLLDCATRNLTLRALALETKEKLAGLGCLLFTSSYSASIPLRSFSLPSPHPSYTSSW